MAILDTTKTTAGDLCNEALRECSAFGVGQTPLAEDFNGAMTRLQWMLQEWERKGWNVYHRVTLVTNSTGAQTYTVGPGGQFDTGAGVSVRPARIEAAFLRQLIAAQPVDYPLELIQSREDYMRVTLKQLTSFTGAVFYDPTWPLGTLYPVPIAQANVYALGIEVLGQLPPSFANQAVEFNIPYEYYYAMMTNLAMRLRPKYGIGTWPGDPLPGLAKETLATVKGTNVAIARLQMPSELIRPGIYNIFSDRSY
jgi:hypothetical protein